jgi:hypothetical protein
LQRNQRDWTAAKYALRDQGQKFVVAVWGGRFLQAYRPLSRVSRKLRFGWSGCRSMTVDVRSQITGMVLHDEIAPSHRQH